MIWDKEETLPSRILTQKKSVFYGIVSFLLVKGQKSVLTDSPLLQSGCSNNTLERNEAATPSDAYPRTAYPARRHLLRRHPFGRYPQ